MVESATNRSYEGQLQEAGLRSARPEKDHPAEGTEPQRPLHPRLRQRSASAAPRGRQRDSRRRLAVGLRRHGVHAGRSQRLYPRLRRRRSLRPADPRQTTPATRRRSLRSTGSRKEFVRTGRVPLRNSLRDGVGPHGQLPRLHPVHGGVTQTAAARWSYPSAND